MNHPSPPLLIIGCGHMGRAILVGAHNKRLIDLARCIICDPDKSKKVQVAEQLQVTPDSITWFDTLGPALSQFVQLEQTHFTPGQVLLAIKPQMLPSLVKGLNLEGQRKEWGNRTIISILAGMTSASIRDAFGGECTVIRVMPNLPASIGQGATAITLPPGTHPQEADFARSLFTAVGPLVIELQEELMDAFTAVAGSGPAYLFYLAEGMIYGAINCGFSPEQAHAIVKQTLSGAAALLDQSHEMPAQLREAVTSKGGTTAAAVAHLDSAQVLQQVSQAVEAARNRARALALGQ